MHETSKISRHHFEAYLGHYLNFWNFLGTYRNAFNALMDYAGKTNNHVDHVAYPMLFIARHCMELGFKANIRYFIQYSEKEDFKKAGTHNLQRLFEGFKLHVNATIQNLRVKYSIEVEKEDIKTFNDYCKKVEDLTNSFHTLDEHSDSFRYPVNKNNEDSFDRSDRINLLDVQELLQESMVLLYHTSDVFSKYTDYAEQIQSMYEQEMTANYGDYYNER